MAHTMIDKNKKLFSRTLCFLVLFVGFTSHAQIKISDNPATPSTVNASAILELESTNKGLIPPRVTLTSATSASPLTTPVENGTLVYNASGSLPTGYYLWQGMWLMVGSKTLNIVEKTTSDTLGKEETMVLAKPQAVASYLLTLALPQITTADNGLSITIKHAGVARGLVKITGFGGSLTIIDENDVQLTRYQSKTFVAHNGVWWIQQVQPELRGILNVGDGESWTTPVEISDFLTSHYGTNITSPCVVRFSQGEFTFNASFSIDYTQPITIEGASAGNTTLKAGSSLGANPLITAATQTHIRNLKIQSSSSGTGEAIRITGATPIQYTVENVNITGFNIGIQQTNNSVFTLTGSDISSCISSGVYINYSYTAATGAKVKINNTNFTSNLYGVNLNSGNKAEVYITRNHFFPGTGNTAIRRNEPPNNFVTPDDVFINGNTWNNTGTFLSGIDFTRSDGRDAKMQIRDNAGYNKQPGYVYYQVHVNTANTTGSANVWRKAIITSGTITTQLSLFSMQTSNRFTYLSDYPSDCVFTLRGDMTYASNEDIYIAILKNGSTTTTYGMTAIRRFNTYVPFCATGIIPNLQKNDYIEVYVRAATTGNIVVRNLNLLLETR